MGSWNRPAHRAKTGAGRLQNLVAVDGHAQRLTYALLRKWLFAVIDIDDVGAERRSAPGLQAGIVLDQVVVLVVLQHGVVHFTGSQRGNNRRLLGHDADSD